jgi:hypothetical protein
MKRIATILFAELERNLIDEYGRLGDIEKKKFT